MLCGIDYQLYIYLYIFIFFSRSLTRLLTHLHFYTPPPHTHTCSPSFMVVHNVTKGDRPEITITKKQTLGEKQTKTKLKKEKNTKQTNKKWGREKQLLPFFSYFFFAAHHWQLQQRGHSLRGAGTSSKRRRWRLLPCGAALPQLEVLQRHV